MNRGLGAADVRGCDDAWCIFLLRAFHAAVGFGERLFDIIDAVADLSHEERARLVVEGDGRHARREQIDDLASIFFWASVPGLERDGSRSDPCEFHRPGIALDEGYRVRRDDADDEIELLHQTNVILLDRWIDFLSVLKDDGASAFVFGKMVEQPHGHGAVQEAELVGQDSVSSSAMRHTNTDLFAERGEFETACFRD